MMYTTVKIETAVSTAKISINGKPLDARCVGYTLHQEAGKSAVLRLDLLPDEIELEGEAFVRAVPAEK